MHLESDVVPGISDAAIESVIDDDAPQVLRTLRLKLGLDSEAFIIPSDANDFLVDQSILTEAHVTQQLLQTLQTNRNRILKNRPRIYYDLVFGEMPWF